MSYLQYVNIKHGTESLPRFSNGNTLPLVQMPFGMNGFAPQTESSRGNWFYHPKDRSLEGIRLTHQPSPWIGDYMPLVMMPQREERFLAPDMRWSGFRPEEAVLMPHYLKVDFLRYRASMELAPTTRGAAVRLSYDAEGEMAFAVLSDKGFAEFHVDKEKRQISGYTKYTSWQSHEDFKMYFVYRFDSAIREAYAMCGKEEMKKSDSAKGERCGIWVSFQSENTKEVSLRLATSFISLEQAEYNLQREVMGKSFEQVKNEAETTWENYLSRIEIECDSREEKRLFYSCMYRVFLFPTKFYERDSSGKAIHFCADTGKVREGLKYVNNGFWDTFRTVYPLYALIARKEYAEILEGFVNTYEDCGWLPKWPSPNEVGMMPGTLIDAVIAEAAVQGIGSRQLLERAYEGVLKHLTTVSPEKKYGRQGIEDYERLGYLPYNKYHESVNNTLDYVYGDYCVGQIAKVLGKDADSMKYFARSKNYQRLFDQATGFMRAKDEEGNFRPDFDAFAWGRDYCEGSAWQNSFAVYHDIEGLAELYGGKEPFLAKIDELFATKPYYKRGGYPFEIHEMTEMAAADFGQCAISNQPSFHIPYIYAALGETEKTEYWVSRLLKEGFSAEDDGFPGDEDNGTMAAWVIFSMLGMYPFCVGKGEYIRIRPQVKRAVIHGEARLTIYHTNDIHSNYEFLKNVHSFLAANRTENDFYFDSGDYNDLKSYLVQSDKGISAMELLMECQPDAMALGNNEIDLECQAVASMAKRGFPVLCCNLTDGKDNSIDGLDGSRIFQKMGKRFLVMGVAPYFGANFRPNAYNLFFEMGNLRTQDSFRCIRAELDRQQGKYDYCILLSHSGLKVDGEIRRQFPEIDLILGGHTHNILSEPGYSQSGRGERLGKIVLQIEEETIREMENIQLELPEVVNPAFEKIWKEKEQIADNILSKELPVLSELSFDAMEECELINYICDALQKHCGGDLAIMHHGIAEGPMLRPVSVKSLLEIFPSKLNPTLFPVLGENIEEAVRMSLEAEHIRGKGEGAGFRGHILGTLGFSSNVRIKQQPLQIFIDGKELDKKKEYLVVSDDYLQRGSGYPSLKTPDEKARFDKWFIRDLAKHFLLDGEVFETMKIRRKHRGK